ncbi:MAG: low temperature requirement protein A [Actinomycetales bacterium]
MVRVSAHNLRPTGLRWPLAPRDPGEEHRASTPLELLFDLCFVVAVGQAAARLHHAVGEQNVAHGLVGYAMVFFAIWWAWMNFSWFGSAYDQDDVLYRLLTLVQMGGVLVLATGIDAAFEQKDFTRVTVGYVIMRVPMVVQWLRAAGGDPPRRQIALRYAGGLLVVQVGWVARLALPAHAAEVAFVALVVAELVVPMLAERAGPMTPWHPEHIAERYGEFTLIVLGESVLATMLAAKELAVSWATVGAGVGGLLLLFSIWWAYFDPPGNAQMALDETTSWLWGYGHLPIFAAVAALGAGLSVAAEVIGHDTHLSEVGAAYAVAVPVSVFSLVLTELHSRIAQGFTLRLRGWVKALGVLVVAALAWWLPLSAVVLLMGAYQAVSLADHTFAGRRAAAQLTSA